MRRRTLALRRETLIELTSVEMTTVAGGSHLCRLTDACSHGPSCLAGCPSFDEPCPSVPVTGCTTVLTFMDTLC